MNAGCCAGDTVCGLAAWRGRRHRDCRRGTAVHHRDRYAGPPSLLCRPQETGATTHETRLLEAVLHLSKFHRDHEEFYSSAPREQAVVPQRHARTLQSLADRWASAPRRRSAIVAGPRTHSDRVGAEGSTEVGAVAHGPGQRAIRIARRTHDERISESPEALSVRELLGFQQQSDAGFQTDNAGSIPVARSTRNPPLFPRRRSDQVDQMLIAPGVVARKYAQCAICAYDGDARASRSVRAR